MPPFKQAPHDQSKADRDGVTNYIPQRKQINVNFKCEDCNKTATWEITADGRKLHACDDHRKEYAITAGTYQEKRL